MKKSQFRLEACLLAAAAGFGAAAQAQTLGFAPSQVNIAVGQQVQFVMTCPPNMRQQFDASQVRPAGIVSVQQTAPMSVNAIMVRMVGVAPGTVRVTPHCGSGTLTPTPFAAGAVAVINVGKPAAAGKPLPTVTPATPSKPATPTTPNPTTAAAQKAMDSAKTALDSATKAANAAKANYDRARAACGTTPGCMPK